MDGIMNFLANYYIWFIIGAIFLGLALIGVIFGMKKKDKTDETASNGDVNPIETASVAPEAPVNSAPEVPVENNTNGITFTTPDVAINETPSLDGLDAAPVEDAPSEAPMLVIEDPSATPDNSSAPAPVMDSAVAPMDTVPMVEEATPEVPTLVIEDPIAPATETTPVVGAAPVVETPVAPEVSATPVEAAPVVEAPVIPDVPAAPVVETQIEATPVIEAPVAMEQPAQEVPAVPEVPVAPVVESVPVLEEAPVTPVMEAPVENQNVQ